MANNKLRIIGGQWRSRIIEVLDCDTLRPTPNRLRETLFNWLTPYLYDAVCLDAFAGSGVLGLEALSRGAASVTFCESQKKVALQLQKTIKRLKAHKAELIMGNCLQQSRVLEKQYDIVFLDPPFHRGLIVEAVQLLQTKHCLTEGAIVYVEVEAQLDESGVPECWQLLKNKRAGEVSCYLYQIN